MGIGFGVLLVVIGAALIWALKINLEFIDDDTLGVILLLAGILTIGLSLFLNYQQRRTTHVEERRYEQR